MSSLDPRINRLEIPDFTDSMPAKQGLDQFETWEVFQQLKEGKPFEHVGVVHSPTADLAFLFAKEQYTRRGTIYIALALVATRNIGSTPIVEANRNILKEWPEPAPVAEGSEDLVFDIFYLKKRGKEPYHTGQVMAPNADWAIFKAASLYPAEVCLSAWAIEHDHILFTEPDDKIIWNTLAEKKYRDAIAYKSQDKINKFKEEQALKKA